MRLRRSAGLRSAVVLAILVAVAGGIVVREVTWQATASVRYLGDVRNGYRWGARAAAGGMVGLYDDVLTASPRGRYVLDYSPLRLFVMTQWAKWVASRHAGDFRTWGALFPLRALNLACELVTAFALAALVHLWIAGRARPFARSASSAPPPDAGPRAGWALGAAAALLFWFNPAVIINAHAFLQWDVWALPFHVLAVLLASVGWWATAGVVIGAGGLLKSQLLLVASFLVLWPLLVRQWGAAVKYLVGFAVATAVLTSPWLVGSATTAVWAIGAVLATALVTGTASDKPLSRRAGRVLAACALFAWPWVLAGDRTGTLVAVPLSTAAAAGAAGLPRRHRMLASSAALAGALFVSALALDGSLAWAKIGFVYGAERFPSLAKTHVANLSSVLVRRLGWTANEAVVSLAGVDPRWALTANHLLFGGYALALGVCAHAAARQAVRRHARFLIAMALPWVVLFLLLPRLHTRHLVWGAALTAVAVVAGQLAVVAHLVLSAIASAMMLATMFEANGVPLPFAVASLTRPDVGWLVLLCALLLLAVAWSAHSRASEGAKVADGSG